jgi:hypothetical protein
MTILWRGLKKHRVVQKKIEKVTNSQDDDFAGVLAKNIPDKLALMGLRPSFSAQVRFGEGHPSYSF